MNEIRTTSVVIPVSLLLKIKIYFPFGKYQWDWRQNISSWSTTPQKKCIFNDLITRLLSQWVLYSVFSLMFLAVSINQLFLDCHNNLSLHTTIKTIFFFSHVPHTLTVPVEQHTNILTNISGILDFRSEKYCFRQSDWVHIVEKL